MKFVRFLLVSVLLSLLIMPAAVSAHGAIFTYKYIDGSNMVMVTHNVHDPQAGASITYNLRLYTMDGQPIRFQGVESQVKRGTKVLHAQTVPATDFDDANFTYTYPRQGNYTLDFTFVDNDKQVAHGEFPVVVAKGLDSGLLTDVFTITTLIAFVAGAAAATVFWQRKRLKLPTFLVPGHKKK
jgi:hypothetical protein